MLTQPFVTLWLDSVTESSAIAIGGKRSLENAANEWTPSTKDAAKAPQKLGVLSPKQLMR